MLTITRIIRPIIGRTFGSPLTLGSGSIRLTAVGFVAPPLCLKVISGDSETWRGQGKLKYNRGGIQAPVKMSKVYYHHVLTFRGLNEVEADAARAFLKESVGYRIGYYDVRGKSWTCIATNPNTSFINTSRHCGWNFSLELEGPA